MTPAQEVLLSVLSCPQQVSQRLLPGIGNGHQRQLSRSVKTPQLVRVTTIRLDPISGPARNQRRSRDLTGDSALREVPLRIVPARPRLVDTAQPTSVGSQPLAQPRQPAIIRNNLEPLDRFAPSSRKNRNLHRIGVPIQPNPKSRILHDRFLPYVALQAKTCNPRIYATEPVTPY